MARALAATASKAGRPVAFFMRKVLLPVKGQTHAVIAAAAVQPHRLLGGVVTVWPLQAASCCARC